MSRRPGLADRRRSARAAAAAVAFAAGTVLLLVPGRAVAQDPERDGVVLATRIDGPITPVVADHLDEVVGRGEAQGYEAVLVELDTPGGLDSSMRDIVQRMLGAEVPVVVFVTPAGARAASAGALIAWSSHVVAMAPGTTIGAATPVDLEGGEVGDKVVNDAAAYARAVAEERGRDVEVAAEAVTEGRALSHSEATAEGVADLVAGDRAALLDGLDGSEVTLADGSVVTLRTAGASVTEVDLSSFRRLLQWLADPNLAFLLMSLGTLGLVYELATPGVGVAGGVGLVMVLLALLALAVLPIDVAGFAFLALAVVLFVVELFAPGIGVAAALGSVSLALAGIVLFRDDAPGLRVSLSAVIPTTVVVGVAVVLAGRLALRARSRPTASGVEDLVGRELVVARASDGFAQAKVGGALWRLRSDRVIEAGDRVRVCGVDGLDLLVEPADPTDPTELSDKEEPS